MKRLKYAWMFSVLFLINCSYRSPKPSLSTSITVNLYPAFDPSVSILVRKENGNRVLLFTAWDSFDSTSSIASDSVPLSEKDWIQFISIIDTGSLSSLKPILHRGLDGIGVSAVYSNGTNQYPFYCWSPQRYDNAAVYKLLDPIFQLLYTNLPKRENLIEDIQNYLDYGLPVKVKSQQPFIAKIYGDLSAGCEAGLQSFFNTVPVDSSSILDLSNFHAMGTLLFPYFKKFDLSHPRATWIVNGLNKEQMLAAGVNGNKMVFNLKEALNRALTASPSQPAPHH